MGNNTFYGDGLIVNFFLSGLNGVLDCKVDFGHDLQLDAAPNN